VDFPWHSFFFGAVKCFRDHFAYSGFVEVRYPHLGSFVLGFDVVAYSSLDVGYLFVNALFFFFFSNSFSCLF